MVMNSLVIKSVETFVLRIPPAGETAAPRGQRYQVAANRGTLYSRATETMFVRIESEHGSVGWGEGLAPVAARVPAAIVADLFTPILVGADASDVRPLWHRLAETMRERGHLVGHQADALAAVDIALWDLLGNALGVPVARLLGGAYRRDIPTYATQVPGSDDAMRAESAAKLHASGVRRFKLHLGNGVAADLASYDAVAAAAPDSLIAMDAHCVYDLPTAIRLARGLDERGAWFLESALTAENIGGHAALAAAVDTPVAVGEALRNRYEAAEWISRDAVDFLQPDIGRTGITEGMAIGVLAGAAYRPILPHHSVALAPALVAALHVCAATENMPAFEYAHRSVALANELLREPLVIAPDHLPLPEGPGLGIAVDEDKVRALAVPD